MAAARACGLSPRGTVANAGARRRFMDRMALAIAPDHARRVNALGGWDTQVTVTTADDIIRIPGFGSGVDDRLKVFDAIGGAHKVLAVYRHGTHNVFTDHRYFDSREVSEQVKQATESLSLAFIDTAYGHSTAELARWRSGHRALLARYDAAGQLGDLAGSDFAVGRIEKTLTSGTEQLVTNVRTSDRTTRSAFFHWIPQIIQQGLISRSDCAGDRVQQERPDNQA